MYETTLINSEEKWCDLSDFGSEKTVHKFSTLVDKTISIGTWVNTSDSGIHV